MLAFSKIREFQNDYLDTRIVKLYQTQILGVADCYLMPYLKKALGEDTHNVFSILKQIFVTVLALFANVLS